MSFPCRICEAPCTLKVPSYNLLHACPEHAEEARRRMRHWELALAYERDEREAIRLEHESCENHEGA